MRCPYCGSKNSSVVDKRDNADDASTRRRRECEKCYKRFTTYERIENVELDVMKKDGNLERFSREKLLKSVNKAIGKRPVENTQVVKLVEDIEMKLLNRKSKVIKSTDIGNMVLNRLRWMDIVAYMRFASIYKDFGSLEDFESELSLVKKSHAKQKGSKE
jgi:transcriptional repressor NrdR